MRRPFVAIVCAAACLAGPAAGRLDVARAEKAPQPIAYTIAFPDPASKSFTVRMVVPSDSRASVDLMMPVWSPGFYGPQNYAQRVSGLPAQTLDGAPLGVTAPTENRWTVAAGGRPSFTATYTVAAPRGSNLGNGVTDVAAVIIGPATYVTLVDPPGTRRRASVTL